MNHEKSLKHLRFAGPLLGLAIAGTLGGAGAAHAGHSTPGPTFPIYCPAPGTNGGGWPDPLCGSGLEETN